MAWARGWGGKLFKVHADLRKKGAVKVYDNKARKAGDEHGRMRLGDVVQDEGKPKYQCRGCDRWLLLCDATDVGGCADGCCDDYECPYCQHITRVEWPD